MAFNPNVNANDCIPVTQLPIGHFDRGGHIHELGQHCLTYDIYQPKKSRWGWESGNSLGVALINFFVDSSYEDVYGQLVQLPNNLKFGLDLQGHTLKAEFSTIGIALSADIPQHIANTTIKNGIINVFGTGISLQHKFEVPTNGSVRYDGVTPVFKPGIRGEFLYLRNEDEPPNSLALQLLFPLANPAAPLLNYKNTRVTADHLTIHAGYRGVVMGGGNNTIRNSIIEVDSHTAIFMYGPQPIIENNTIIIHRNGAVGTYQKGGKKIKGDIASGIMIGGDIIDSVKTNELDGAIKLRDAQGGIIRNNRIIYKGGFFSFGKAPVAINLLDSKDVLIENNTIEGFKALVRKNGDTTFTDKNNTFK